MSVGRAMESLIPGARLVVIPRAGHLSNVESPLRFNSVLRAFCLEGGAR